MPNLKIGSGEVRLSINDDETKILVFDPQDALFAEKFYLLVKSFDTAFSDFIKRAEAFKTADASQMGEGISLLIETCRFVRDEIDKVFGAGTSQMVFGDTLNLEAFTDFFDGITPYVKVARQEKISQYTPHVQKPTGNRKRRK